MKKIAKMFVHARAINILERKIGGFDVDKMTTICDRLEHGIEKIVVMLDVFGEKP